MAYSLTGSFMESAKVLGIAHTTLRGWADSPWWLDLVRQVEEETKDHPGRETYQQVKSLWLYVDKKRREIRRKGRECAQSAKHRAAQIQATPKWADLKKIRAIYQECQRMNMEGAEQYEVDHIVPLLGTPLGTRRTRIVCGLHAENNLQIIPKSQNSSKNSFWSTEQ